MSHSASTSIRQYAGDRPEARHAARRAHTGTAGIEAIEKNGIADRQIATTPAADHDAAQPIERLDILRSGERDETLEIGALFASHHARFHTIRTAQFPGRRPLHSNGSPTGERQRTAKPSQPHGVRPLVSTSITGNGATKPASIKVPGSAIHAANPALAPLVEAALPAADAEPKAAREILAMIGAGAISTVRTVLRGIVAEGRAVVSTHAIHHGSSENRYRRTATHEAQP